MSRGGGAAVTRYVVVPGDISGPEIERRYSVALRAIRQARLSGVPTGYISDQPRDRPRATGAQATAVLQRLERSEATSGELATDLRKSVAEVKSLLWWLRKTQRVQVVRWTWSAKRRRVAVYGLVPTSSEMPIEMPSVHRAETAR